MDFDPFVKYGHHRGLIATRSAAPIFPGHVVEVVHIGVEGWVGLSYPDGARIAMPIESQPKEVQEAFKNRGEPRLTLHRPQLKKPVLKHPASVKKPLLKRH